MHIKKMKLICPSKELFSEKIKAKLKKKFDCLISNIEQKKFNKIFYKYQIVLVRFNHYIPFKKNHSIKYILSPTTGINHINKKYFGEKNVRIFSLRNEKKFMKNISASSEFTILLILMTLRKIKQLNENLNRKHLIGNEIANKKIGIIGIGRIGLKIAKILRVFGGKIYGYDKNLLKFPKFINRVSLDNLLKNCEIISINIPLNKKNINFLNKSKINMLKKNTLLVNTSRGEVLDEHYILKLVKKKIIFYSTDVIKNELKYNLMKYQKCLENLPNLLWTKHIAGLTKESILKTDMHILNKFLKYYEKN